MKENERRSERRRLRDPKHERDHDLNERHNNIGKKSWLKLWDDNDGSGDDNDGSLAKKRDSH